MRALGKKELAKRAFQVEEQCFGSLLLDGYIYYDEVSVCLCVTKNEHFLLGVSCNHLNPLKPPCTTPS